MQKVVLVEDEPAIVEMYRFKLQKSGYDVATSNNGQEGLVVIEQSKPDLILLDLKMPVMSGDEMLRILRTKEWGASIPVVVLTNISRDEAPHDLRFLHINRYIVKAHYTPQQVLEVVNEILQ